MNRGARATTVAVGIAFGFLVTGSGFGNYTTIHQALLLRSWYLFAVFGSAVAVAAAGLALLRGAGVTRYGGPLRLPRAPARRRHVFGAVIFGAGFGLTGTCPGGAVAVVATGGLGGLLVLAGLAVGMWLRGAAGRPARDQHLEAAADQREQPPLTCTYGSGAVLRDRANMTRMSVTSVAPGALTSVVTGLGEDGADRGRMLGQGGVSWLRRWRGRRCAGSVRPGGRWRPSHAC